MLLYTCFVVILVFAESLNLKVWRQQYSYDECQPNQMSFKHEIPCLPRSGEWLFTKVLINGQPYCLPLDTGCPDFWVLDKNTEVGYFTNNMPGSSLVQQRLQHPETTPITNFRRYFLFDRPNYQFPDNFSSNDWSGPSIPIPLEPVVIDYGDPQHTTVYITPYKARVKFENLTSRNLIIGRATKISTRPLPPSKAGFLPIGILGLDFTTNMSFLPQMNIDMFGVGLDANGVTAKFTIGETRIWDKHSKHFPPVSDFALNKYAWMIPVTSVQVWDNQIILFKLQYKNILFSVSINGNFVQLFGRKNILLDTGANGEIFPTDDYDHINADFLRLILAELRYHMHMAYGLLTIIQGFYSLSRNWNTHWSNKGFVKMSRDRGNNCAIASYAMYPLV